LFIGNLEISFILVLLYRRTLESNYSNVPIRLLNYNFREVLNTESIEDRQDLLSAFNMSSYETFLDKI